MKMNSRALAEQYFNENPGAKDDVIKAFYAYHIEHFRLHKGAHNFTSGARENQCVWCKRSREEVRWDDLPPTCQRIPVWVDTPIADVILGEEKKAFAIYDKAKREIPKIISRIGLSGQSLAVLYHTHGYDIETVTSVLEAPASVLAEYEAHMESERDKSRSAHVAEVIIAK